MSTTTMEVHRNETNEERGRFPITEMSGEMGGKAGTLNEGALLTYPERIYI